MTWERLEEAGGDLLRRLGPTSLRTVTEHAMSGWPREANREIRLGHRRLTHPLAGLLS